MRVGETWRQKKYPDALVKITHISDTHRGQEVSFVREISAEYSNKFQWKRKDFIEHYEKVYEDSELPILD